MWLPYFLAVFVLISQLISNPYATIDDSMALLWLPGQIEGNFLADVEKFRDENPISSFAGYIQLQARYRNLHEAAICYFEGRLHTLRDRQLENRDRQLRILVNQVIDHILRHESMSRNDLKEWCQVLTKTMQNHRGYITVPVAILYAFHTLRLKNYEDEELTREIEQITKRMMKFLRKEKCAIPIWVRELLHANWGLDYDFRIWGMEELLFSEPRLKDLAMAMHNNDNDYIVRNLDDIFNNIFSPPPPKNLSAQTRVASIAALFHLLRGNYRMQATRLMESLSSDHQHFFLFDHELQLVNKVLLDHHMEHSSIVQM
ncbi:hypothetical protein PtB15_1B208 [Puccinia triticina]|nr:hypothetical protein PtB15_1B208 [Puccinia triticina]